MVSEERIVVELGIGAVERTDRGNEKGVLLLHQRDPLLVYVAWAMNKPSDAGPQQSLVIGQTGRVRKDANVMDPRFVENRA